MFDDRLRLLRISKNLSIKQVAQMLGLKERTYRSYENNEREPDSEILINIAKLFNVSIDYLLNFDAKTIQQNNFLKFSTKEISLIKAYRNNPDMQKAVDILLGIAEKQPQRIVQSKTNFKQEEIETVPYVARNLSGNQTKGYINVKKEDLAKAEIDDYSEYD